MGSWRAFLGEGLIGASARYRGGRGTTLALVFALSIFAAGCDFDPVDVIVYAERVPSFFRPRPTARRRLS